MKRCNIAEALLCSAEHSPNKRAVVDGDVELSYQELNEEVNRVARVLIDVCSVCPGDNVAYLLPNGRRIVEVYYAIQKIGAVAVPINTRLISREIGDIVNLVEAKALIYDGRFANKALEVESVCRKNLCMVGVGSALRGHMLLDAVMEEVSEDEPELFRDESALSRIQFTGGSTGVPKGAARTHAADLIETEGILDSNGLACDANNVVLIQSPLEHHGGHSWLITAVAAQATIVLLDQFDPGEILRLIEHYRVTYLLLLPPTSYARLLAHPDATQRDLSSVTLVQSSAGGTTKTLVEDIFRFFPNAVLNYGWGQSECGLGSSIRITRGMLADDSPQLLSVGKPMLHAEMKVVDEEGNKVPQGVAGELLFRSPASMQGYYRRPETTKAVMAKGGWLRTGDIMCTDEEGNYYFKTRKRDVIKSGGENVFVGDVETVLLMHPEVCDCVVFGTGDEVMGEAVAAVVEPVRGRVLTAEELQDHCRRHMASYKKPRYILFVEDMERDDAGKIRKQCVVDLFEKRRRAGAIDGPL